MTAEIERATRNLEVPVPYVVELLQSDRELLNSLLSIVNAPFYRFDYDGANVELVVSRLGYKRIASLAIVLSLIPRFPPP